MEVIFWTLTFLVIYTYVGYGLILYLLVIFKRLFSRKTTLREEYLPAVTLIIPAYNEADFIEEKAKNSLELNYPKDKLRILFVTDGSKDDTVEILNSIDGVEVSHEDRRAGKAAAENRSMKLVETPIVIFCDANTHLNENAIRELVKHYQNPKVGAVAGEKHVMSADQDNASGSGEGLYWRYESALKRLDSELHTVVGAAGELISFRTELVEDLEEDTILDDFVQSLRICLKGYRVLYEPKAVASETASANVSEELKRKVRIAAGGWQAMFRLSSLLNIFRHPVLSFQYISHRVLRWSLSAFALPIVFFLNVLLWFQVGSELYGFLLMAQVGFYLMALLGWVMRNKKVKIKGFFVAYYFCVMNYAVYAGLIRFFSGKQQSTWEKSKRAVSTN